MNKCLYLMCVIVDNKTAVLVTELSNKIMFVSLSYLEEYKIGRLKLGVRHKLMLTLKIKRKHMTTKQLIYSSKIHYIFLLIRMVSQHFLHYNISSIVSSGRNMLKYSNIIHTESQYSKK